MTLGGTADSSSLPGVTEAWEPLWVREGTAIIS